ncbi:phage major capsid protein [Marinobacter changyiensis]|uniref:phage major capsid protein n=1 Tax=Marinobacter changyiensis TaxID=2604091 RepID=UPI0012657736|nr:phage major capsid protein [Marinobacter changyiensis]
MSNEALELAKTELAKIREAMDTKHGKMQDQLDDLSQKSTTPTGFGMKAVKSVGSMISEDAQFEALRNRSSKSAIIPITESVQTLRKSVVGDAGGVGDSPYSVEANRANGIMNDPRRRLSLLDLMQRIMVSSNSFEFTTLDGFVDAAAYQLAEGDAKATQTLPTALQTVPIATIAVLLGASEQVIADAPQLQQFINSRLIYGVTQKLESEIINGAGGVSQINGLLNQATAFTTTLDATAADGIGEAIAELESTGWMAGAVVLHPKAWQTIRSERNTAGEYVASGWDSPAGPNLWNVPVVTNAAMPETSVLVMDPSQVALLDRQQAQFEIGRINDDFQTNTLRMRSELRSGLAVMAPSAVLKFAI